MIASIDWEDELADLTAEEALRILDKFLNDIRQMYIPSVPKKVNSKPKWLNRATKTAINRKKHAWDKYKKIHLRLVTQSSQLSGRPPRLPFLKPNMILKKVYFTPVPKTQNDCFPT